MSVSLIDSLDDEGVEPRRSPRVLVADDNNIVRASLRVLLNSQGCDVDEAADGHQALVLASRHEYDLLLLDVQMPDMGGLETAEQLSGMTSKPRPRLYVMTAEIAPEELAQFRAYGAWEVLSKPVRLADILRIIDSTSDCEGVLARAESRST